MKMTSMKNRLSALIMVLVLVALVACTGQNDASSESPSAALSSSVAPSSKTEPQPPSSSPSSESQSEAPQPPVSSFPSSENQSETPQPPVSSVPSSESRSEGSQQESSAQSPNDSPVSEDEPVETAVEIMGNPTPDDFQGENFFVYDGLVCLRADGIEWVMELGLTEGELLGEIIRTGITKNHADWDATDLPVATKIYQHSERREVLIAIYDDTKIPYLKMIEG